MNSTVKAVVFDVGRVIVQWDMRCLFAKLIDDPAQLDWFLANVVTEEWHFQHDAGRPLADMVPERKAMFPDHADLPTCAQLSYMQDIVVSGRECLAKPDPAIFRLAADRFGHLPQEMLFIDDNAANIAAARQEGWQTHHFADAASLAADLRGRGLLD